jgi:ribosome-associated translation inhibitor RaiA
MTTIPGPDDATVEKCLILGHGFHDDERHTVVAVLDRLDHRLVGEPADGVRFDLHMKDPGHPGRKITLECHIAGLPTLVATATDDDTLVALAHVRDELLRQLSDEKSKRAPHH